MSHVNNLSQVVSCTCISVASAVVSSNTVVPSNVSMGFTNLLDLLGDFDIYETHVTFAVLLSTEK